jgi:hypothetical protein
VPTTTLAINGLAQGGSSHISSISATCYEASFQLPGTVDPGQHVFTVVTPAGESEAFTVVVSPKTVQSSTTIDVEKEHGGDITAAVKAAAAASRAGSSTIRVQLGRKTYPLTAPMELPDRTALVRLATGASVLELALPVGTPAACHPSRKPVHPPSRCDSPVFGCDCLVSGIFGAGTDWGVHNLSVVLVSSPHGTAALWVPPSSSGAKLTGLDIRLLEENITNNAIHYQGEEFEFGHNSINQVGACWFNGPNARHSGHYHAWGGTDKAVMIADGARGGWIHHNQIYWNCGGWGILDKSERIILEENHMKCIEANYLTNGVIEGGSGTPLWDGYREIQSRFWSIARNNFSRPVMNGACTNGTSVPGHLHVNCSEAEAHQNWIQRETLTTDSPGEFGHGFMEKQDGLDVTMRWSALVQLPFPSTSLIVIAGRGLGQRRFITAYDNATSMVTLDRAFDQFVDGNSILAAVNTVGEKTVVGNRFNWTEVVQLFGNTYGGVFAENTFENANALRAAGTAHVSGSSLQAIGSCYHGAGTVFYTEYLANIMRNSDGITLSNRAFKNYGPHGFPCNATPGFGLNVSWLHWSVVRRNTIGGISQVALSINRTVPKCGGIRATCAMSGYPGLMASTDVIVERNQFDCPSPGVSVGTVVDPSCSHCVQKSSKE